MPLIKTVLCNPIRDKCRSVELVIDTGFQGGVLIPLHIYMDLGLNLFEEPKVTGRTALGNKIELRTSRVIVDLNGLSILCTAYTGLGVRKPLLGREILKEIGLLYKPPEKLIVNLR